MYFASQFLFAAYEKYFSLLLMMQGNKNDYCVKYANVLASFCKDAKFAVLKEKCKIYLMDQKENLAL